MGLHRGRQAQPTGRPRPIRSGGWHSRNHSPQRTGPPRRVHPQPARPIEPHRLSSREVRLSSGHLPHHKQLQTLHRLEQGSCSNNTLHSMERSSRGHRRALSSTSATCSRDDLQVRWQCVVSVNTMWQQSQTCKGAALYDCAPTCACHARRTQQTLRRKRFKAGNILTCAMSTLEADGHQTVSGWRRCL